MQDQILDMLLKKDEITWQELIYDLVRTEQMDPWDVDLSLLAKRYLDIIKQLKEVNFFISGKVVLAAAILLKLKCNNLISEKIADFDSQLFYSDEEDVEQLAQQVTNKIDGPNIKLTIKTPQTRKRRVQLQDLIDALEKALEVDEKRNIRRERFEIVPEAIKLPERKLNVGDRIKIIYGKINDWFKKNSVEISFEDLLTGGSKRDKVLTFIPLLHLENDTKIDIKQEIAFEKIYISLNQELIQDEINKEN
jgi:segregation and condensation protein A